MSSEIVLDRIRATVDQMSPQLQVAAKFLLDHPREVALLSMREQARGAGVQPATMTRLAKWLGFSGFEEIRGLYADAIRGNSGWFGTRAAQLVARQKQVGEAGLITLYVDTLTEHLSRLKSDEMVELIGKAGKILADASRIYCLGMRSAFPVAYQVAYVQSYLGEKTVLLDSPGGAGLDPVRRATSDAALFVVTVNPYARASVEIAEDAGRRGLKIVTVTDSELSPVARISDVVLTVGTGSPSFFDTIAPAFAIGEILVALIAARAGPDVPTAVREMETRLTQSGAFWAAAKGKRR
jgi:DNA-binding MurR/RpiR family transcriptional regulator